MRKKTTPKFQQNVPGSETEPEGYNCIYQTLYYWQPNNFSEKCYAWFVRDAKRQFETQKTKLAREDLEDILQESLIDLWTTLEKGKILNIHTTKGAMAYLRQIFRNKTVDHFNSNRNLRTEELKEELSVSIELPSLNYEQMSADTVTVLKTFPTALTKSEMIFLKSYIENGHLNDDTQIAKALTIPKEILIKRRSRVKKKLQDLNIQCPRFWEQVLAVNETIN